MKLITVKQAAELAGVTLSSIYALVAKDAIRTSRSGRTGRSIAVSEVDIKQYASKSYVTGRPRSGQK